MVQCTVVPFVQQDIDFFIFYENDDLHESIADLVPGKVKVGLLILYFYKISQVNNKGYGVGTR